MLSSMTKQMKRLPRVNLSRHHFLPGAETTMLAQSSPLQTMLDWREEGTAAEVVDGL